MPLPNWRKGEVITAQRLNGGWQAIGVLQSQLANIRRKPEAAPPDTGNVQGLQTETWTVSASTVTDIQIPIVDDQQQQIGTATVQRVTSMTMQTPSGIEITFDLTGLYPP